MLYCVCFVDIILFTHNRLIEQNLLVSSDVLHKTVSKSSYPPTTSLFTGRLETRDDSLLYENWEGDRQDPFL